MIKKIQIFVSSTYQDLKEERQAAVEAILKAGHIPAGMELFAAGNQSQFEIIKRWIDESDAYLLILGGRYGTIELTTSFSYIELEYDYAVSIDKPLFAIVISEDAIETKIKKLGSAAIEKDHPDKLKLFREKVLSKISSFFDDSKDIKLAIHESLADMLQRSEFIGWIRGDEMVDQKELLTDISNLRKENTELKAIADKYHKMKSKPIKKVNSKTEEEFEELRKLFTKTKIATTVFNKEGDEKPVEKTLIELIYIFRESLVTGANNRYDADKFQSFLFFTILPKLEIHSLATQEKVAGVQWKNYHLSIKGLQFMAYLEKIVKSKQKDKA